MVLQIILIYQKNALFLEFQKVHLSQIKILWKLK